MDMPPSRAFLLFATVTLCLISGTFADRTVSAAATKLCVIGAGIGGSSLAHFFKQYTCAMNSSGRPVPCIDDIRVFERRGRVGGRMAVVNIGGDTLEAGASVLHPTNLHARGFARLLGLNMSDEVTPEFDHKTNSSSSSSWFGIWDGSRFVFQTLRPPPPSSSAVYRRITSMLNSLMLFWRYGRSLLRMNTFVQRMVQRFVLYYSKFESRPVFETVEDMLKWSGLYELTQRTLQEELVDAGVSPKLISELITVITRINYGQSVGISGLAGAVSLAGSDSGLWSVNGGNWQLAAGILKYSDATLHLHEGIKNIAYNGGYYTLESTKGDSYDCEVTVIATPLDEMNITFTPPVSLPKRRLQHTFTTIIRGLLNPKYFGVNSALDIPYLVGTLELSGVPFSSISVLRKYSDDAAYKIFSRTPLEESLLDQIFSSRKETIRFNWAAYPHYDAPEVFAPIILDDKHLYYINSFENAASTIETSAVAAENVARLIISRLFAPSSNAPNIVSPLSAQETLHFDL